MDAIDIAGVVRNHLDFYFYGKFQEKKMEAEREYKGRELNPLVRVKTSDAEEFEITIVKVK